MRNPASVLEYDTQTPLGFWHTNGFPNLGQKTRPYNNNNQQQQQQKERKKENFAVPVDHRIRLEENEND